MANMSDYLEAALRDHLFRTATMAKPAALYIALFTAAPSDAGGGTEVAGGGYARVARNPLDANWTAPSATSGLTDNAADITFPAATAAWGTITHIGIFDAAAAGNLLFWAPLAASKVVGTADTFYIPAGSLDVTFA